MYQETIVALYFSRVVFCMAAECHGLLQSFALQLEVYIAESHMQSGSSAAHDESGQETNWYLC